MIWIYFLIYFPVLKKNSFILSPFQLINNCIVNIENRKTKSSMLESSKRIPHPHPQKSEHHVASGCPPKSCSRLFLFPLDGEFSYFSFLSDYPKFSLKRLTNSLILTSASLCTQNLPQSHIFLSFVTSVNITYVLITSLNLLNWNTVFQPQEVLEINYL